MIVPRFEEAEEVDDIIHRGRVIRAVCCRLLYGSIGGVGKTGVYQIHIQVMYIVRIKCFTITSRRHSGCPAPFPVQVGALELFRRQ